MERKPPTDDGQPQARSIGQRMAHGAAWLIALRFAVRALGLVSLLIVARLLLPEDYALIALATTIAALLEVAGDFGAELMVIREQNATREDYDTAFTITLLKGVFDALVLTAVAVPIAEWFGDPRLENVIYCCAIASLLFACRNVGVLDFRKNLEINKEFTFQITGKLAQFVTVLVLAYIFRSYWALMAGILAHRVFMLGSSYVLSPYRPRLSLKLWRKYFHFSKWIACNNLLMFGRDRLDTLIIAKMGGPTTLGHYQLAHEIANLPTTDLVGPVTRALFPGYSMIANDRAKLAPSFVDSLAALLLIAWPFGLGLGLIGDPLVALMFNENWQEAAPLITALAVFGVIRAGYANSGALFMALGKVQIEPILMAIYIVIVTPLIITLIPIYGPLGAAYALIITATINLVLNYIIVLKLLDLRLGVLMAKIWRIGASCLLMTGSVVAAMALVDSAGLKLIVAVTVGGTVYVSSLWALWSLSGGPHGPERQAIGFFANTLQSVRARALGGAS